MFLLTGQPEATWSHGSVAPNHRLSVITQVHGSWAISLDAPTLVLRADGKRETVVAGAEVILNPGDALVHPDETTAGAIRNPGADPAVALFVFVQTEIRPPGGIDWSRDFLPGKFFAFDDVGGFNKDEWAAFRQAGGPVAVTIREVTLVPGTALPPSDERVHSDRYVEIGTVSVSLIKPGQATPRPPYLVKAGGNLPWQALRAGQVQVLSNQTAAPAVFLEVALARGEVGAALPIGATPTS